MRSINVMEIVEKLGAQLYGDPGAAFDSVVIDTRKVVSGSLYIGFKGERVDGNTLYPQAFAQGATVCLVENVPVGEIPKGCALLLVKSTHRAILDLAYFYRKSLPLKIIGITGSTGKTSTKDILHGMLSKKFRVFKTSGNFNNEIGLPLMILSLDESYDYAILEMGMSAPLEIHNLARVAQPDIAVITNIGISHIEFLGSQENILRAKMEITDFFRRDSLLVLNGDDEYLSTVKDKPYTILRGGLQNGDYVARNLQLQKAAVSFTVNKGKETITMDIPGKHNIHNGILCYIVAKSLGMTDAELHEIHVEKSKMRMDLLDLHRLTVINDCYNANPDSMKSALDYLSTLEGRKVAILGTMRELGNESLEAHQMVARFAKEKQIDTVMVVGEYAKAMMEILGENALGFATFEEAAAKLHEVLKPQDTVLLKASRGMAFERFLPILEEFGGGRHE